MSVNDLLERLVDEPAAGEELPPLVRPLSGDEAADEAAA
jgi:hypothetical protein